MPGGYSRWEMYNAIHHMDPESKIVLGFICLGLCVVIIIIGKILGQDKDSQSANIRLVPKVLPQFKHVRHGYVSKAELRSEKKERKIKEWQALCDGKTIDDWTLHVPLSTEEHQFTCSKKDKLQIDRQELAAIIRTTLKPGEFFRTVSSDIESPEDLLL